MDDDYIKRKVLKKGSMGENKIRMRKKEREVVTFTVAECGEFHNMGEYHEGIRTLDEAVAIYQKIPIERMHGIPSIGINLHVKGTEKYEDLQADILSGNEIIIGMIKLMPQFCSNPQVEKAIKGIIERFPEKEVIDF